MNTPQGGKPDVLNRGADLPRTSAQATASHPPQLAPPAANRATHIPPRGGRSTDRPGGRVVFSLTELQAQYLHLVQCCPLRLDLRAESPAQRRSRQTLLRKGLLRLQGDPDGQQVVKLTPAGQLADALLDRLVKSEGHS